MIVSKQHLLDPNFWDTVMESGARVLATIALAWLVHSLILHFVRAYRRSAPADLAHTEQARRTETLARVF